MKWESTLLVCVGVIVLGVAPARAQMTPGGLSGSSGGTMMTGSGGGMTRTQFVQNYFADVLGRTPSAEEVSAWTAFLAANPGASGGRMMTHAFFDGPEYDAHAVTAAMRVRQMYEAMLGRDPSPAEQDAWVQEMLNRWMEPTVNAFTASPEFHAMVTSQDRAALNALVMRMYQQALGRTPSGDEVDAWTNAAMASSDPSMIVHGVLRSPEYQSAPRRLEDHVTVMYRAILGRDPSPVEVAAWTNFMAARMSGVEDEFSGAPEFQARCAGLTA